MMNYESISFQDYESITVDELKERTSSLLNLVTEGQRPLRVCMNNGKEFLLCPQDLLAPICDADFRLILLSAMRYAMGRNTYMPAVVSDYIKRPFDMEVVHRRVLNTIKLYAKQRRLVAMVMNQVFEKEKNSRMLISVLSEIVEFRNGESGTHVLNINTLTTMILEQLVPQDHLLRKIDRSIDFSFIRRLCAPLYSANLGRPAIEPEVLFRMLFVGYLYGISVRSDGWRKRSIITWRINGSVG